MCFGASLLGELLFTQSIGEMGLGGGVSSAEGLFSPFQGFSPLFLSF